ncbi:uncharacterized, partial [Tachysurus ichikawai]
PKQLAGQTINKATRDVNVLAQFTQNSTSDSSSVRRINTLSSLMICDMAYSIWLTRKPAYGSPFHIVALSPDDERKR